MLFGSREVVGEPVDDAMAFQAEGLGVHVAEGPLAHRRDLSALALGP